MNTLEVEERIRAATRAAGDTVTPDSVPPLRLPADHSFRFLRFRTGPSRWATWLAPAAAAAAVVAVAVAMVTVGRAVTHSSSTRAGPGVASARPGPVRTGPPVSSYVASGQVPKYYVAIESNGNPNFNPSYAVVRETATGQSPGGWTPASGQTVVAVTAAADDRTFIADVQPRVNANQSFEPRTFFALVLDQAGIITSVRKESVSVPAGQLMTGFALSPDGSKLAIAVQPDNDKREPDLTVVKVITLATGATQIWTGNGTIGFGPDDARSLSWTADQRTLAFDWAATGPGINVGVRLLDLGTGGGSLLSDSREAVVLVHQARLRVMPLIPSVTPSVSPAPAATSLTCQEDSIITPDGSAIVCGAIAVLNQEPALNSSGVAVAGLQRGAETEYIEYSTASGKVARVLGHWKFGNVGALSVEVLWSNASGSVLIGAIPNSGDGRIGVISGNEFTPLPVTMASVTAVSGTW